MRAHAQGSEEHTDSAAVIVRTLPEPLPLELAVATPHSLTVTWPPLANASLQSCVLQYCTVPPGPSSGCRTQAVPLPLLDHPTKQLQPLTLTVSQLQAKTNYSLHLEMAFPHSTQTFLWPRDSRFTFQTLGDRPSAPGTPVIQHLHRAVYQVTWQPSEPNGSPVQVYSLQGWVQRKVPPPDPLPAQPAPRSRRGAEQSEPQEPLWDTFYNGSGQYI